MSVDLNNNLRIAGGGGGGGGTSQVDEAPFVAGTTPGTPIMGADTTNSDVVVLQVYPGSRVLLEQLAALLAGVPTAVAFGQATMANSLPVAIASNQAAIPVTSSAQNAATGNTKLLTVTHVTAVAITTVVACGNVTVVEDNSDSGWPTTPFQISKPLSGSTAIQFPQGASYSFPAPFGTRWADGVTVGYIILPATGSATFSQDESA